MMKRTLIIFVSLLLMVSPLQGCASSSGLDPKNPITLTMWHNFGGVMKDSMDTLVGEFNNTVGLEKGIIISIASIAASKEQNDKLSMIANGDPGAPEMPDIATAYPSMAIELNDAGLIADLSPYFTEKELSSYLPQFVSEGRLSDGKLYVFPFAKSTEALFVDKTLFDRFSESTGVTIESLSTFEGIASAAEKYHEWSGGKAFFAADSWFNIAMAGTSQLGADFIGSDSLNIKSPQFKKVWDFSIMPSVNGSFDFTDGYSSDLSKTGEIVCCTGSTAGILFYGDTVTYPDNTTEKVEYTVMPYPVFEGGKKTAIQRGAGLIVAKTEKKREYAASEFIKWFTDPNQNMRFISSTGYIPVTKKAFDEKMDEEIALVDNAALKRLLTSATQMYREYDFIVAPNIAAYQTLSTDYEANIRGAMAEGRTLADSGESAKDISDSLYRPYSQ